MHRLLLAVAAISCTVAATGCCSNRCYDPCSDPCGGMFSHSVGDSMSHARYGYGWDPSHPVCCEPRQARSCWLKRLFSNWNRDDCCEPCCDPCCSPGYPIGAPMSAPYQMQGTTPNSMPGDPSTLEEVPATPSSNPPAYQSPVQQTRFQNHRGQWQPAIR